MCMDHLRGGLEEESNSNVAAAVYRAWESMTFKLPAAATSYFITFCGSSPRYNTVDGKRDITRKRKDKSKVSEGRSMCILPLISHRSPTHTCPPTTGHTSSYGCFAVFLALAIHHPIDRERHVTPCLKEQFPPAQFSSGSRSLAVPHSMQPPERQSRSYAQWR